MSKLGILTATALVTAVAVSGAYAQQQAQRLAGGIWPQLLQIERLLGEDDAE